MVKATRKKMEYIASYEAENYDKVLIRFPKGTKDRILETGKSVNGFTVSAVLDKLSSIESPPPNNDQ